MALLRQTLLQLLQLALIRQPPKPKQMANLFEARMLSQFMNIDAAIGKHALVAIDVTNAGGGRYDAFQAFRIESAGAAGHKISLLGRTVAVASRERGEGNFLLYPKPLPYSTSPIV